MKIWIATGGTGGHVFPALSVASQLVQQGHRVTISCDRRVRKMVMMSKPGAARVARIWASGVGARGRIRAAWSLVKIGVSTLLLGGRFMVARPDRVVAFGGYASVPAVVAAHLWRVPTYLHEQNAAIGRANRFALRWVRVLMNSFPDVSGIPTSWAPRVVYTGLPVRQEFLDAAASPLPNSGRILVTGGSLGAQILDDIVPVALAGIKNKKIFVTHQTRPENVARLRKFYADHKIRANVLSFIHDMAGAVIGADLIIGRSGASTVVELETVGRPAILVPLGINPDQAANAAAFEKLGAGFAVPQSRFTARWLGATLTELFDNPSRLAKMAHKAYVPNHATDQIVDVVTGPLD